MGGSVLLQPPVEHRRPDRRVVCDRIDLPASLDHGAGDGARLPHRRRARGSVGLRVCAQPRPVGRLRPVPEDRQLAATRGARADLHPVVRVRGAVQGRVRRDPGLLHRLLQHVPGDPRSRRQPPQQHPHARRDRAGSHPTRPAPLGAGVDSEQPAHERGPGARRRGGRRVPGIGPGPRVRDRPGGGDVRHHRSLRGHDRARGIHDRGGPAGHPGRAAAARVEAGGRARGESLVEVWGCGEDSRPWPGSPRCCWR